jgi:phage shock protein E
MIIKNLILLTVLMLLSPPTISQPAERQQIQGKQAVTKQSTSESQMLIIDVRTTEEWQSGHLSDAHHIEWQDIGNKIISLADDKDAIIYLYCRSGNRSGKAMTILKQQGYTNVINAGGIDQAQLLLEHKIVRN